jgi:hypothetical protein
MIICYINTHKDNIFLNNNKKMRNNTGIDPKSFLNTPIGGIKESNSLPVNFHPKGGLWITPDKSASFALLSCLIHRGCVEA